MSNETFYRDLNSFSDFSRITDDRYYESVPDDWVLFVTDVKNSTDAIEDGRYRDVNKIGAASITVVKQALEDREFPFVFGGDGATLIIPPTVVDRVRDKLLGLRRLAREQFDLDLRVGQMNVSEVRRPEVTLEVAKYELTPGREISIFRGGGITLADDLVKEERERYEIEGEPEEPVSLTGLSCRWQPIPTQRGTILSVLVQARSSPPGETYDEVLKELDGILSGGLTQSNPVDRSHMSYQSAWACLKDEVRYQESLLSFEFIGRFLEILLAVAVFQFGFNPGFFDPDEYGQALRTHSDYRKFDDMLRLIIDCNPEEKEAIESYLSTLKENEQIFYGTQASDESLMTCYVEELSQGGHLHFIDGGDGGYARAAKQLKEQIRRTAGRS